MNWTLVEELQLLMLLNREFDYQDPWFLREFLGFINWFKPTSFVETGTYKGSMLKFIHKLYPQLPLFSCDVIEQIAEVQEHFKSVPNVHIEKCESVKFLEKLTSEQVGELPFFFLDAHSAVVPDYPREVNLEPLAIEMEKVMTFGTSVVCIHDFKVPSIPEFGHGSNDMYVKKYIKIDLDVIKDVIQHENVQVYFPMLPQRLLQKGQINWTGQFGLRGRVYLLVNFSDTPLTMLESFGLLRRHQWTE